MKSLSLPCFLALAGCAASGTDLRLAGLPLFDGPLCSERRMATLDEKECLRRLTAFAGRAMRSTVVIRARTAAKDSAETVGAGVVVDSDGRVFTAYHLVRDRTEITAAARQVGGADGRLAYAELPGVQMRVKAYAERLDLALLEPVRRIRWPYSIMLDRMVHAFDQGQELWFFGTDSDDHQGPVVTGLDETVELPGGERRVELIRVGIASADSDLGGPVLASDGTVVGIMLVADETGNASYFIPVFTAVQLFGLTWIQVTPD